MSTRQQNERKFSHWVDLPDGGRRYWLDIAGHRGWWARYVKLVDAQEQTTAFYQEIYNEVGRLVETHHKFPTDTGHRETRSS